MINNMIIYEDVVSTFENKRMISIANCKKWCKNVGAFRRKSIESPILIYSKLLTQFKLK